MFEITPYNKIKLDKGDGATFAVELYTVENKPYEPVQGDTMEWKVYTDEDVIINKTAQFIDGSWVFGILPEDTEDIEAGVYMYSVALIKNDVPETVISDALFDLRAVAPEGSNE